MPKRTAARWDFRKLKSSKLVPREAESAARIADGAISDPHSRAVDTRNEGECERSGSTRIEHRDVLRIARDRLPAIGPLDRVGRLLLGAVELERDRAGLRIEDVARDERWPGGPRRGQGIGADDVGVAIEGLRGGDLGGNLYFGFVEGDVVGVGGDAKVFEGFVLWAMKQP